jgi:Fe-S cluster biogenesis protein NfuA
VSSPSEDIPVPIDTVPTPNPDAVMLKVQETLVPTGTYQFTPESDTSGSPLAQALLQLSGIELVLIAPRFVTLRKDPERAWPDIVPAAKTAMREFLSSGQMAVLDSASHATPEQMTEIEERIVTLLNDEIRPAIAQDGGDLTYMGFEDGIVKIQMIGACGTCPSSTMTLKMGIERLLMEEIPEVRAVEQI